MLQVPTNKRLIIQPASSNYPTLGATYKHDGYNVDHANRLARTGKHYHDSKAEISEGFRMSTAGEELTIQLNYEIFGEILKRTEGKDIGIIKEPEVLRQLIGSYARTEREKEAISYVLGVEEKLVTDPRKAKAFDDLFARGPDGIYMWQWTETFLRVPKGKATPAKPDYVDPQGRKYWAREFGNGNDIVGVVYVPEGGCRVVPKTNDLLDVWDPVTGLPRVTSDDGNDTQHDNHTTHFWFDSSPSKDSRSGHYDVAVVRRCDWLHDEGGRCLDVGADYGRSLVDSTVGFRLVRGSLPLIEKI